LVVPTITLETPARCKRETHRAWMGSLTGGADLGGHFVEEVGCVPAGEGFFHEDTDAAMAGGGR